MCPQNLGVTLSEMCVAGVCERQGHVREKSLSGPLAAALGHREPVHIASAAARIVLKPG